MTSLNDSRRDFLKTSALAAAALTIPNSLLALEDCTATSHSGMKLSLAAYSFNRYLPNSWRGKPKPDTSMTLMDFVDYCGEQGVEGTELTGYYFPQKVNISLHSNHIRKNGVWRSRELPSEMIFVCPQEKNSNSS